MTSSIKVLRCLDITLAATIAQISPFVPSAEVETRPVKPGESAEQVSLSNGMVYDCIRPEVGPRAAEASSNLRSTDTPAKAK